MVLLYGRCCQDFARASAHAFSVGRCGALIAERAASGGRGSGVGQGHAGQVAARGHVEFAEHFAEVIADGAGLMNSFEAIFGLVAPRDASVAI